MGLATENLNAIEIFAEGRHGADHYTRADLQAIVDAFPHVGFEPILKLDDGGARRQFGSPALGFVDRIYITGSKLYADLKQVPRRVAEIIRRSRFKKLATEIYWNYKDEATGRTYPRALKGLSIVGADIGPLNDLASIENLFSKSAAAHAYAGQRAFKTYGYISKEGFPMSLDNSLTVTSRQFAKAALDFAEANDMDYPTAVKHLMREQRLNNYEYGPPSPANELANIAKKIQGAMKIDFVGALLQVAKQFPGKIMQIADDWLIAKGKELGRNQTTGGFSSDAERNGLLQAIREYPEVAEARLNGKLTESALRTLFQQWFTK